MTSTRTAAISGAAQGIVAAVARRLAVDGLAATRRNYSAAKAGIHGFTKTLAGEFSRCGVAGNAIASGSIGTEITEATAERSGVTFDEVVAYVVKNIPVLRGGLPPDIAHAASFFASENAWFISGQGLRVAGGPRA